MSQIEKISEYIVKFFEKNIDPKYAYHNLDHTLSVLSSVQEMAKKANLNEEESLIIQVAALFHDTGFVEGPENHEERSATIAEEYLRANGFEIGFIDQVKTCIYATKLNSTDDSHLSVILQDADLSGLASEDFFDITERLRVERNVTCSNQISKKEWANTNVDFLNQCQYKSKEGVALYKKKKDDNLAALKKIKKRKKRKKRKEKTANLEQSISTNKSAQTQFKTALRNHIDLSNIADNKANIMLSVNALILTVALPFLIDKSISNIHFLLPTFVMSAVCLVSMIFATLATRPIKMHGHTSQERIKLNQSNLFFFGNYYKMNYADYKSGIEHILNDSNALDDSIMRDLYYLGRSLGNKFNYLRWCYNIFMYGITATVLSLLIVYIL